MNMPGHPLSRPPRVKPINSVLVKPAGPDCNLNCRYCFYLKKADLFGGAVQHRMIDNVLEEMVRQIMRDGSPMVHFGWQGGEPTLMGLDFFRMAVEFQKKYGYPGQVVGNGLQTNGTLLDETWADFFHEYQWLIGLSLDGPQHVHDHYRLTRGGEPTWERVAGAARMLHRRGVAANALSVVSDYSSQHADEIYDYLKSAGFEYMQFIPCVETDPADPARLAPFSVSPTQYGEFLCRIFDRWIRDFHNGRPTTSVRWFDALFYLYVNQSPPDCTLHEECGIYVAIEHNGNVYACDFFVDPEWQLGNLMEGDILEMLNSPRQDDFGLRKAALPPECPACPWVRLCRGGCPKDRLRNPAGGGSNHFCASFKMFFEHADTRLRHLAVGWLTEQTEQERIRQRHGGGVDAENDSAGSLEKKRRRKKEKKRGR